MAKKGYEQYDYGIYRGQHHDYDLRDKSRNLSTHTRLMLNKSLNMFEYHNLPDSIPEKELERILQTSGYAGIVEVEGKLYAVWGGLGGVQDEYYRPTTMTVANPGLKTKTGTYSKTLTIGEDVVLMRNDDNMVGLIPIFAKYGTLMNEADLTMYIMLINKRAENIISASDDNTAESARQYLKKLEEGELGYIQDSKLYDSLKTNPTHNGVSGSSFTEITELIQYLKGSMYNEIGLNANFNMKRERLNTSEIEMNSEALYPLVDNMLYNRRLAIDEINKKFGTDIRVEFNSSWDYRLGNTEDTGETPLEFIDEDAEDLPVEEAVEGSRDPLDELTDEELDLAIEEELKALEGKLEDTEEVVEEEVEEEVDVEEREGQQQDSDTGEVTDNDGEVGDSDEQPSDDSSDDGNGRDGTDDEPTGTEGEGTEEGQEEGTEEGQPDSVTEEEGLIEQEITIEIPVEEVEVDTALTEEEGEIENEEADRTDGDDTGDTDEPDVEPDSDIDTGSGEPDDGVTVERDSEEGQEEVSVEEVEEEVKPLQRPMNIVRILQRLNPFNPQD